MNSHELAGQIDLCGPKAEIDRLKKLLKIAAKGFCNYECHWNSAGNRMVHCEQCRELKRACK